MRIEISSDLIRIVVLDISGLYAQIHDEATLPLLEVVDYIKQYQDKKYKIIEI